MTSDAGRLVGEPRNRAAAGPVGGKSYLLLFAIAAGALLIHGYHPTAEDSEIYVPAIKKLLNPALYPHDARFFMGQTRLSLFPQLVAVSVRISHLSLDWALFLGHFLSIFLTLLACLRIGRQCFLVRRSSWCGVGLVAALLTIPVAGTALYIMDPYFTARSISTFAITFAIASWLEGRIKGALLWALFGFAIHPLMAAFGIVYLVVLLCCDRLWGERSGLLPPLLLGSLLPPVSAAYRDAVGTRSYLFLARWQWYEWLGVIGPLALLWWFVRIGLKHDLDVLARMSRALFLFGLAFLFAGLIMACPPWSVRLAEFQPMRALHLLYVLLFVSIGGLLVLFVLKDHVWRYLLLFVPLCSGMWFAQHQLFPATSCIEWPSAPSTNSWVQAFVWIRQNTPVDAYFALDPHYMQLAGEDEHGFRAIAERSRLSDSAKDPGAVTVEPANAEEWHRQVQSLDGWKSFRAPDFRRLGQEYSVSWVVVENPGVPGLTCPYQNQAVRVCRIQ